MEDPTNLYLPPNLPFPITITAHAVQPSGNVQRGTCLLSYSYVYAPPNATPEVRYGTWESTVEGTLDKWNFKVRERISARRARDVPAVLIIEPCKHGVQLGGLCCLCGKDMTIYDYTGFSDASRASIQMTHLANGPVVSFEEAQRIERETAQHLLKSRKLSLIVDLDQTIVHATVDPTVGEWIAEGEAWEKRQAAKAQKGEKAKPQNGDAESGTDSEVTISDDEEDEVNPNWEALKDVKKFRLGPEALGQPVVHGPRGRHKDKSVEQDGCMYYIKPRPGWQEFLREMSAIYEMHVYTMGTRAYAEEVCAAIDPEGSLFGGRILSRDESGSLTQKSLQRLFPCDQSMVVIIDDRADVWEWSPNLLKVVPYDFFVGIGDINSAFLPRLEPLTPILPTPPTTPSIPRPPTTPPTAVLPLPSSPTPTAPPTSESRIVATNTPESLPEGDDEAANALRKQEILHRNHEALDAQLEERPLARKQEALQEAEAIEAATTSRTPSPTTLPPAVEVVSVEGEAKPVVNGVVTPGREATPSPSLKKEKLVRKALLKNDDRELVRIQELLEEVHRRFYEAYDEEEEERKTTQKRTRRKEDADQLVAYDVRTIIPEIRMKTLEDVHLLFSSVIPLDVRPESTEIWKTAEAFGARCYTELNKQITHVVAAKRGTVKVDAARRQGRIKIVWLSWFTDSIALWHKQDETNYLMDPLPPPVAGPSSEAQTPVSPQQVSSDPEPDAVDWDEDGRVGPDKRLGASGGAQDVTEEVVEEAGVEKEVEVEDGEKLALDEVDWDAINNEVDAFMNESDDESGSGKVGGRSGGVSEDDSLTDESNSVISSANSTPRKKRKRPRSSTPSEGGASNHSADADADDDDLDGDLRSPLAKRKKLVADRSGGSKLKEAFSAEDVLAGSEEGGMGVREGRGEASGSLITLPDGEASNAIVEDGGGEQEDEEDEEDEEGTEGAIDVDDDFLARELGEDWG